MSSENYQMLAKTFAGLEEVLKSELEEIGAADIEVVNRGVKFSGSKELLYRANFCCRTAIRILRIIGEYKVKNNNDLYQSIYKIDWSQYFNVDQTFAVNSTVNSEAFNNSMFVSLKAKDAIVDQFRSKTGKRPSVNAEEPDIRINVHASADEFSISLDSSGESLHKRGYRVGQNEASMSEVLAAGILKLAGWNGQCDFYDGMCGSGTLAVEAALIARNIPPGIFRKSFAFECWNDFDPELFEEVYNDDYERQFDNTIYASDINSLNVKIAERNARSAGIKSGIDFKVHDFASLVPSRKNSLLVINPPYGERMHDRKVEPLYTMIGDSLKKNFVGCNAWVFSGSEDGFKSIGLRPSEKIKLYNGPIECSLRKYELFDGNQKDFKQRKSTEGYGSQRFERNDDFRPRREGAATDRNSGQKPSWQNRPDRNTGNRRDSFRSEDRNDRRQAGRDNYVSDNRVDNRPNSRDDKRTDRRFDNNRPTSGREGRTQNNYGDRRPDNRVNRGGGDNRSSNGMVGNRFENSEQPKFEYLSKRPKTDGRVEILSSDLKHTDKKGVYQPKEEPSRKPDADAKTKRKRI